MGRTTRIALGAALAALLAAGNLSAGPLPSYTYNASPVTPAVPSDSGKSKVTLSDEPTSITLDDVTDVVLAGLKTSTTVAPGVKDVFTNEPWKVGLTITDVPSGKTNTLYFTGVFNGYVKTNAAKITNTFTSPTTQFVVVNGWYFTVAVVPSQSYVAPGYPGATREGSIGVSIVDISQIRPEGAPAPEPSSLALAGLALAGGVLAWRRRRAPAPAAA